MTEAQLRDFIRAFYDALASRQPEMIEPFLADDVEWQLFGPLDLFPFCGRHRGKQAVLTAFAEIGAQFETQSCDRETALIAGDRAAVLVKFSAVCVRTGRVLSFRVAQFTCVREGKIGAMKILFDTLDAAEQVLGRQIDLSEAA